MNKLANNPFREKPQQSGVPDTINSEVETSNGKKVNSTNKSEGQNSGANTQGNNGALEQVREPREVKPSSTRKQGISGQLETQPTSKISQSINQKATDAGFEDALGSVGYDKISIKDQISRAKELFTDKNKALAVLRGDEPLPNGLNPLSAIIEAENHIARTGDTEILTTLSNSPLIRESSTSAQTLRLARERIQDSVTKKLEAVKRVRGEHNKAQKESLIKESKKRQNKLTTEERQINKFLDDITC